tara:strand:- start:1687 stop:2370 length:684 start_codon:yes stop_codon:yes gene_type:complete
MKTGVWIPIEIWELSELTLLERYILSDISSFHSSNKTYFKTNSKLAEECKVSRSSITRAISNLVLTEHIKIKQSSPVRKLVPSQIDAPPSQIDAPPSQIDAPPTQIDSPPSQIDAHINKVISKRISKEINTITKEVVFPFQNNEFIEAWSIWILERKEKKLKNYTQRGEQSALHNLQKISGDNYKTAIQIINNSITHGWQGLFALKEQKTRAPKITADSVRWANSRS